MGSDFLFLLQISYINAKGPEDVTVLWVVILTESTYSYLWKKNRKRCIILFNRINYKALYRKGVWHGH